MSNTKHQKRKSNINKNKPRKSRSTPQNHVDFRTLNNKELKSLRIKWHKAAYGLEVTLQDYMNKDNARTEKIDKLWKVANSLWRRVSILERWLIKNNKQL